MKKDEPEIIINGINLEPGCVLTIRVAIEVFAADLMENGLGEDEHAQIMVQNYRARIDDIRRAMRVIE